MTILKQSQPSETPPPVAPSSAEAILLAVQSAQLPLAIADARRFDAPIVVANPAFLAMTGYDEAEVVGRNCRFLQGPEPDPQTLPEIRQALGAGACGVIAKPYSEQGVRTALAFLATCLREGRAPGPPPVGFTLAPAFARRWGLAEPLEVS